MIAYKVAFLLAEGLVFALLAIGIYVAFYWQRFPDLTPDGSFVCGACAYAKVSEAGLPLPAALLVGMMTGACAGAVTALVNRWLKVPTVVAGLVVSSALYSVSWLLLGKPNQFVDPDWTLYGSAVGVTAASRFVSWTAFIIVCVISVLHVFARTVWGLRLRALGENPSLARELPASATAYTVVSLAIANGIVALAGALFAQRSYSADVNMGVGTTVAGLAGMILGLAIATGRQSTATVLTAVAAGAIAYKIVIFAALEIGVPAEAFRLVAAVLVILLFATSDGRSLTFLRSVRWS